MAEGLPTEDAIFSAVSQRPTAMAILETPVDEIAGRNKPSCGIIDEGLLLHRHVARFVYARSDATVVEIEASHVSHLSHRYSS